MQKNTQMPAVIGIILFASIFFLSGCVVSGLQKKGTDEEIAQANVNLAAEYYRLGKFEFALGALKKALKADSDNAGANALIALLYTDFGEIEEARAHYEVASEQVQENTVLYGRIHNNYGAFLCANKQYIDGEEHFMLAIESRLYKTPAAAYENAGFCALKREDSKMARLYYEKVLLIDAKASRSLLAMAKLDVIDKDYKQALSMIGRFNKVSKPSSQSLWVALQAEFGLKNKNKAQKLLKQIKQGFPDSSERMKGDSLLVSNLK